MSGRACLVNDGRTVHRILAVDDDERILRAYQRSTAQDPTCELAVASSRTEAIALAHRCAPDLALVDLCLGSESGIELIRELRAHHTQAVLVMVTGYASAAAAVSAMRAGADDVVMKPVSLGEILSRVEANFEPNAYQGETPTLERAQWEHVQRVLFECGGNISMAARRLGIYRSTLQRWLRRQVPRT